MVYCKKCGTELSKETNYCSKCGSGVADERSGEDELKKLQLENAKMENSSRKAWSLIGGSILLFVGSSILFTPIGGIIVTGITGIVVLIVLFVQGKKRKNK